MKDDIREALVDDAKIAYDLQKLSDEIARKEKELIQLITSKEILISKYKILAMKLAKIRGVHP